MGWLIFWKPLHLLMHIICFYKFLHWWLIIDLVIGILDDLIVFSDCLIKFVHHLQGNRSLNFIVFRCLKAFNLLVWTIDDVIFISLVDLNTQLFHSSNKILELFDQLKSVLFEVKIELLMFDLLELILNFFNRIWSTCTWWLSVWSLKEDIGL